MEQLVEESGLNSGAQIAKAPAKKLNLTSYALLTAHGFYYVVSVFVTTFLISYIYKISTNYVLNIGLFYCFNYISMGIFSIIVSSIIDRTNRVVCYRIAIIVRAVFIFMVVFMGEKLASVVVLAGILHGFSDACYWCSYSVMKNELIPNACANKYTTLQIIENKSVHFVVPIILGKIIDADSFKTSAIIVLVVAVAQTIASLFIKSRKPENSHYDLKAFFNRIKSSNKNKDLFKTCFIATVLFGLTTLIAPINTIIVMLTFKSNFSLGLLTGIFSAVSIVMLMFAKRWSKKHKSTPVFITCVFLSIIPTIIVTLITSKITLIIFNFAYIACGTIYSYYYDFYRNVLLKKLDMYDDIAEYQGMVEAVMEASRVIGFALMIVTGIIGASFGENGLVVALKIFFIIAIVFYALMNLALSRFEKKLKKYEII